MNANVLITTESCESVLERKCEKFNIKMLKNELQFYKIITQILFFVALKMQCFKIDLLFKKQCHVYILKYQKTYENKDIIEIVIGHFFFNCYSFNAKNITLKNPLQLISIIYIIKLFNIIFPTPEIKNQLCKNSAKNLNFILSHPSFYMSQILKKSLLI
ncbi:hypothetical protein BpHYR1_044937 [Brachionus plicatilis]|uniref:Uncharacterized protein n=1 Tax=Brachionus plicatilis TaxID=10195 RepID=A0A3M7S0W2_BRAPC|nr:hypothetical protein BpHYR1_044937 [Brachionus plicatilis]